MLISIVYEPYKYKCIYLHNTSVVQDGVNIPVILLLWMRWLAWHCAGNLVIDGGSILQDAVHCKDIQASFKLAGSDTSGSLAATAYSLVQAHLPTTKARVLQANSLIVYI